MLNALLTCLLTQSAQTAPPFLRDPDLFGTTVVFSCEGDLWLGDLTTMKASRLTRDEGRESSPRFSPDGKQIAFTAQYDGADEVYIMPTAGGAPKRLTYKNDIADCLDWTPDGKSVAVRLRGYPASYEIHQVPVEGGYPQRLPLEFAAHLGYGPTGLAAFTRFNRATNAWFHYTGGLQNAIWTADFAKNEFKEVYKSAGTNEYPVWAGGRICFVEESKGQFTLKSVGAGGQSPRSLGSASNLEIRALQSDGIRLVYERGRGIEIMQPAEGKATPLNFELASDFLHTRPFQVSPAAFVDALSLTGTGKRVLVSARGQIISLPNGEGEAKVLLAKPGARLGMPELSPDAKTLAFISDETGEQQLYVSSPDGADPKQLTKDSARQIRKIRWSPDSKWIALTDSETRLRLIKADGSEDWTVAKGESWDGPEFDFSPDSKWLAYQETDYFTFFHTVMLLNLETRTKHPVGQGLVDNFSPAFSSDGKWLAFLSRRVFNPRWDGIQNLLSTIDTVRPIVVALRKDTLSPFAAKNEEEAPAAEKPDKPDASKSEAFRIDLDGIESRQFEAPTPPGSYRALSFAGERLLFTNDTEDGKELNYYDLKAKAFGSFGQASSYRLSADGKKLLLIAGAGGRVLDASAKDASGDSGRVGFGGLQLTIEPVPEWRQIFWEAWRFMRDYFYVKNMHGHDWPKVGAKYAAFLPSVRSRDELDELIRWMQAELGISHSFLSRGDSRTLYKPAPASFLGIDVAPDAGGHAKITRILRGDGVREAERSPLTGPGMDVKEGDYLISVAGVSAKAGSDWQAGLIGRAGQIVSVVVNDKPNPEGARTLYVKPVANERRMRYLSWEQANRDYVDKASGGKLGYIHLAAMVQQDVADFLKQYFGQRGKDGLVLDVRYNTGGNVSDQIATILKQRPVVLWNQRNNPTFWTRQSEFFPGPVVCLINEFNYSDGEEFPFQFRKQKLGTIVGRRTRGGEVGSDPGWPLVDGGRVSVPNYGAWTPEEGWIIEGHGVDPDIDVPSDPNLFAKGQDPQLDRAIKELLESLKRNPVKRPVPPPDPVRVIPPSSN